MTLAFTLSPAPQILTRDLSNSAYGYTPPTLAKSYTANGLNQYTEVGGATFTNDARGNLTSDGSRTFAYDLENHLTSVSGSASMTLAYDPLGRLRETVSGGNTTQFLYDSDRLVAEYDGSNTLLRRYAHGRGVDEPLISYEGSGLTDRRTHHADNQGSIIATSDGSGVGTIQTYGPYGEPTSWSGSRFKYTGQIAIPEVTLYHYKARVYDPVIGRFLQTDPVGYQDQMSLYAYVKNDPVNATDPTGEIAFGFNFEITVVATEGGNLKGELTIDFETGEIRVKIEGGTRGGAHAKGKVGVFTEPSKHVGNAAAAKAVLKAEVEVGVETPFGGANASAVIEGGIGANTDIGVAPVNEVIPPKFEADAHLGPVKRNSEGRTSVELGAGAGGSSGPTVALEGSVSIPDTVRAVQNLATCGSTTCSTR